MFLIYMRCYLPEVLLNKFNIYFIIGFSVTKASFAASIFLIFGAEGVIDWEAAIVYFAVVVAFFVLRLLMIFFSIDLFAPFENLFCSLFMGGLMDALKRAMEKKEEVAPVTTKNNPGGNKPKEE